MDILDDMGVSKSANVFFYLFFLSEQLLYILEWKTFLDLPVTRWRARQSPAPAAALMLFFRHHCSSLRENGRDRTFIPEAPQVSLADSKPSALGCSRSQRTSRSVTTLISLNQML